jgi:hypothetical protein
MRWSYHASALVSLYELSYFRANDWDWPVREQIFLKIFLLEIGAHKSLVLHDEMESLHQLVFAILFIFTLIHSWVFFARQLSSWIILNENCRPYCERLFLRFFASCLRLTCCESLLNSKFFKMLGNSFFVKCLIQHRCTLKTILSTFLFVISLLLLFSGT